MTSDDPEPRMVKMGAGGEDKLLRKQVQNHMHCTLCRYGHQMLYTYIVNHSHVHTHHGHALISYTAQHFLVITKLREHEQAQYKDIMNTCYALTFYPVVDILL